MAVQVSSFRLIIFDLDDTLIPSTGAYRAVEASLSDLFSADEYSRARNQVKERLGDGNPMARNRLSYFKQILENQGKFTPTALAQWMSLYESRLESTLRERWIALRRNEFFKNLSSQVTCVIATNENLRTQLIKLKLMDPESKIFKKMLTSEEMGVEKPNPLAYVTLMKTFGVQPSEVLVVGDSFESDIEPAIKLGMNGVLTREFTLDKKTNPLCQTIEKLEALPGVLGVQR